jgi:hypothetical protein
VSARLPKDRIIAVEMFRGPDHIAMRMGSGMGARRVGILQVGVQ